MPAARGANLTNIKEQNQALALRLLCTGKAISRAELAKKMGLTKTTLGNIVSELIDDGILQECTAEPDESTSALGRRPIVLDLAPDSPVIIGLLIKRNLFSAVLADLKGRILRQSDYRYTTIDTQTMIDTLLSLCDQLLEGLTRPVIAIGISSLGPVDTRRRKLLNPANFWGIRDLSLAEILTEHTGLPARLIHDCSAGALAEKIYGTPADISDNLLYLHIMNGIGAGYILNGQIYDGDSGLSGELGHTSIHYAGPQCSCGNRGCLELYANVEQMNRHIAEISGSYHPYTWEEIIAAGTAGKPAALSAIEEFCGYLSYALGSAVTLMDINHIIVGYETSVTTTLIEDTLTAALNHRFPADSGHHIRVTGSSFGSRAPLIGSIAVVTDKIFNGDMSILHFRNSGY